MLILPTKGKWFRMILAGIKPEEYREMKPYYRKRFQTIGLLDAYGLPTVNKVNVMFRNGYSGNAPSFIANVSLDIKTGREEWGAESGKEYYTLRIHEIHENVVTNAPEMKNLNGAKRRKVRDRMDRCCGTCKWHEYDDISGDFVCVNGDSDCCADWTDYSDSCEEWEERDER